jgi:hypothetical protein
LHKVFSFICFPGAINNADNVLIFFLIFFASTI